PSTPPPGHDDPDDEHRRELEEAFGDFMAVVNNDPDDGRRGVSARESWARAREAIARVVSVAERPHHSGALRRVWTQWLARQTGEHRGRTDSPGDSGDGPRVGGRVPSAKGNHGPKETPQAAQETRGRLPLDSFAEIRRWINRERTALDSKLAENERLGGE